MSCSRKIGPFDCCSVVQGDCLELMKQLPDGCVDAVITDPPYGIKLANHAAGKERSKRSFKIHGDESTEIGAAVLEACRHLPTIAFVSPKVLAWPGKWQQMLCWDKGGAVGGGGDVERYWKQTHEYIQTRNLGKLRGNRDCSVLRYYVTPADSEQHPCQKPEELMIYLVGKVDAETILDPFAGSGTTLVAAKKLGRHFLGFEISPEYCEIARKRLDAIDRQPSLFTPKPEQLELGQ